MRKAIVYCIQAWGGEPLLEKKKLLMLRKKIVPQKTKVHISIETNATLLKPSVVNVLFENHIGIGISIDGMQEVHDYQRHLISGKGSYGIVVKNLLHN